MKDQKILVIFDKTLRSFQNNTSLKVWENQRGFESGPERGGSVDVSEPVMNRQNYLETDHVKKMRQFLSESFIQAFFSSF